MNITEAKKPLTNMDKPRITIKDFQKGMAESAYLGFEEFRGLDITSKKGACFPNKSYAEEADLDATGYIVKLVNDGTNFWAITDDDKIWKRTGANTWADVTAAGSDTGMAGGIYWKGYVACIADADIDWYHITTNALTGWDAAITSGGTTKPAVHASDDCLYIGSGRYVDKIEENTGQDFAPGTSASYTVTKAALDLPEGELISAIHEVGDYLAIVGIKKVYLWDKVSTSFEMPVNFNREINTSVAYNNNVYCQVGARGEWFVTNGTTAQFVSQIPNTFLSGYITASNATVKNEIIYFTISSTSGAYVGKCGIYSLNPKTGAIALEHLSSQGATGVQITALAEMTGTTDGLMVAWYLDGDPDTYGVDVVSSNYGSDTAYFISPFYRANYNYEKKAFQKVEIQLTKPMASGDSISIWYRTAQNETFTSARLIGTMSYSADGAIQSKVLPFAQNVDSIQFKVSLNDEAELLEVTVW
jgi:hypothetical protein